MENIVKIRSTNAFSDSNISKNTNNVGAPAGSHFPMNQKIVDFSIPASSGVYDLSNSYMVLNTTFNAFPQTADANAINGDKAQLAEFSYDHNSTSAAGNTGGRAVVPHGSLVKNIQMYSQRQGMIESLRRQNLLKNTRYNLEKSAREKFDDPYAFNTTLQDSQQVNNSMHSRRSQVVVLNTNVNQIADTGGSKTKTDTELRIPLHQVLDFCKIDEYDTDHYGETKIHMELDMDKLVEHDISKDVDLKTVNGFDGANPIGQADDVAAPGTGLTQITLSQLIVDPEQECPFYVGQQVNVAYTCSVNGALNQDAYITQISYDHGGINQAPPTNSKKLTLFFNQSITPGVGGNISAVLVGAKATDQLSYDVNFAELVLVRRQVANPPKQIEYTAFSVEEDHGNGLTNHKKTYFVEPNCQTLYIIAAESTTDVARPTQAINSYRISIDGVDQTGNRDVKLGSALHRDRIQRAYDNRGVPYKDSRNAVVLKLTNQETGNAGVLPMSCIVETMPITEKQKLVEVDIQGAGALDQIILYKELIKSV